MFKAVYILCAIYAGLLTFWAVSISTSTSDAAGIGMAWGFFMVGAGATGLFAVPALVLALARTWPRMAITLAAIPAFLAILAAGMSP